MSKKFNLIKNYYDNGFWTKEMVKNAVGKWITSKEYDLIVTESESE